MSNSFNWRSSFLHSSPKDQSSPPGMVVGASVGVEACVLASSSSL